MVYPRCFDRAWPVAIECPASSGGKPPFPTCKSSAVDWYPQVKADSLISSDSHRCLTIKPSSSGGSKTNCCNSVRRHHSRSRYQLEPENACAGRQVFDRDNGRRAASSTITATAYSIFTRLLLTTTQPAGASKLRDVSIGITATAPLPTLPILPESATAC